MSTNLKKFIITLNDNKKYQINADRYLMDNSILSFMISEECVATFNSGRWLDCFIFQEPSLIHIYNDEIQPLSSSNKELISVDNPQTLIETPQVASPLTSVENNTSESLAQAISPIVQEKAIDSFLNNEDEVNHNVLDEVAIDKSHPHDSDKLLVEDNKVEDNTLDQESIEELSLVNNTPFSTPTPVSQPSSLSEEEEEEDISDYYRDIGIDISKENNPQNNESVPVENQSEQDKEDELDDFLESPDVDETDDETKKLLENESLLDTDDNKNPSVDTQELPDDDFEIPEVDAMDLLKQAIENDGNDDKKHHVEEEDEQNLDSLMNKDFRLNEPEESSPQSEHTKENVDDNPLSDLDALLQTSDDSESNSEKEEDNTNPLDELDSLIGNTSSNEEPSSTDTEEEPNPLDELDALMKTEDTPPTQEETPEEDEDDDPMAALDDLMGVSSRKEDSPKSDQATPKSKEYEEDENFEEDESINREYGSEVPTETSSSHHEDESLEALLSKLPNDNKQASYEASYKEGNREIRRVQSSIHNDLDELDSLIGKKASSVAKPKEELSSEFREAQDSPEYKRPVENLQLKNSQGRLLTPQEVRIKKDKIIEQTVFQYCSKFPKFDSKHLFEILSKNPKAMPYKITEEDIIWVTAKMIRAAEIEAKFFIREHEQKKLQHFLPDIMSNHWDGSISNLNTVVQEIPQLSNSNLMDLSVWLLENAYV